LRSHSDFTCALALPLLRSYPAFTWVLTLPSLTLSSYQRHVSFFCNVSPTVALLYIRQSLEDLFNKVQWRVRTLLSIAGSSPVAKYGSSNLSGGLPPLEGADVG